MKKQIIKENAESDARRFIEDADIVDSVSRKIRDIIAVYSGLNKQDKQTIKQKLSEILWLAAIQFVKDFKSSEKELSSEEVGILLDDLNEKYLSKLNKETTKKEDAEKLFVAVRNGTKQNRPVEDILEETLSSLEKAVTGYSLDNLSLEEIRELGKSSIKRGNKAFKDLLKQYESRGELTALYDSPDCIIYLINTMEAAVACGAFTEWCTARTDEDNLFNSYDKYGLGLIWFPDEQHTYRWNGANITFGKRFGVTLNDFPENQAQTEVNDFVPEEIEDLLYKYIGKEKTKELLNKSVEDVDNRNKQRILKKK